MKRYSIMGRQHGSNRETEIAQCDTNPEAIVQGAQERMIKGRDARGKRMLLPMYDHVYFVEKRGVRIKR